MEIMRTLIMNEGARLKDRGREKRELWFIEEPGGGK